MSAIESYRSGRSARAYATGRSVAVLIAIVCLLSGCAQGDSTSEKDRPGGFYGGVSDGHGM
jgi:hypothetical protein